MTTLRNILHDADPVRHEPNHLDLERDEMRRVVVAAASAPAAHASRRGSVAAIALVWVPVAAVATTLVLTTRPWASWAPHPAAVPFEVRLAEDAPGEGLSAAPVADSNELIYLHADTVVANADLLNARVWHAAGGQYRVHVEFTGDARHRLDVATSGQAGRRLAVVVDGQVATAPPLTGRFTGSGLAIGSYNTLDEARRIADGLLSK